VKLPCGKHATGAAFASNLLVGFGFFRLSVQFHLHGAFHVIAKLSALVLRKAIKRHFSSQLLSARDQISLSFYSKALSQTCFARFKLSSDAQTVYNPLFNGAN